MTADAVASSIAWSVLRATSDLAIFAGILAGIVFLALADVAKPPKSGEPTPNSDQKPSNSDQQLPLMVAAFFSFVVSAFLFGVLHGDAEGSRPINAFAQAICPSVVLAIGVVQLAVSLAIGLRKEPGARRPAKWVAYATTVIAVVFLTGIVVSPFFQLKARAPLSLDGTSLWVGSMVLVALPYVVLRLIHEAVDVKRPAWAVAWLLRLPDDIARLVTKIGDRDVQRYIQVQMSIVLGVAAALIQNILTSLDVETAYEEGIASAFLVAVLVVVGVPIAALALEVGADETRSPSPPIHSLEPLPEKRVRSRVRR